MRFIIYGVGAIGGTLAAKLHLSGYETIGIARGRHLEKIRQNGLRLRTPDQDISASFACVERPAEIDWQEDDIVFLTMKTQDTQPALLELRAAGVENQAIICAQNAVENERLALRLFPNTYGMTVMMPSTYVVPGEVDAFGAPHHGLFDLGRVPHGTDETVVRVVDAMNAANFAAFPHENVMRSKYGKLLSNLGNVVDAALGKGAEETGLPDRAREEAKLVYKAAGIEWDDVGSDPRRRHLMRDMPIAGADRVGSSSTQSLKRGAGSIETDYLNGEIALLGRQNGVPTPINEYLTRLGARLVAEGIAPGSIDPDTLLAGLDGSPD